MQYHNIIKNQGFYTVRTVPQFIYKGKMDSPLTHIYMTASYSWLDIGTSIQSGGAKLVVWIKTSSISEIIRSYKYFPHVLKTPTLACKWMSGDHLFSFLCCVIMCLDFLSSVLWCPLWFLHKTMFGLSFLPVVCRRVHVLFTSFAHIGVQLRLVCPMLPISLDCPFLIAPSVFSNVY